MLQYYMGKDERVRRPNKQNSSTLSLGVHHCAPLVVGTEFLSRENIETKKIRVHKNYSTGGRDY